MAALTGGRATDIDVFLTCRPEDGEARLRDIYAAIQSVHLKRKKKHRFMATRSKFAVTFYLSGVATDAPPIQIVTRTHTSTLDVLLSFDVDCCCFAYNPSERAKTQGMMNQIIYTVVAIGSLSSGAFIHYFGWNFKRWS